MCQLLATHEINHATHILAMKKSRNAKEFSERLQLAMKNAGVSQADLARKMGTAWSTVARWHAGSMPRKKTLIEIAEVLCVVSRWLESGEGEMNLPPRIPPEEIIARMPETLRPIVAKMLLSGILDQAKIQTYGFLLASEELAALANTAAGLIDDPEIKSGLLYLSKTVTKEAPSVRTWYTMLTHTVVQILGQDQESSTS